MEFNAPKVDFSLPNTPAADTGPSMGYADNFDRKTVTKNPAFLNDLRGRYGNFPDQALLDMFYSDENWAQLNTLGAAERYLEGGGTSTDEKSRNARLSKVWDGLPFFYQEGGRGIDAAGDIATSVLLDPINLIGGFAAKGVAQGAMRTAVALGKGTPIKAAAKGMTASAATEGALSAGQEAIINVSEQSYKQDIGLQTGFNQAEFNRAVGLGAVMGAGVGGVLGTVGAVRGVRAGRVEGDADVVKAKATAAAQKVDDAKLTVDAQALAAKFNPQTPVVPAPQTPVAQPQGGSQETTTTKETTDDATGDKTTVVTTAAKPVAPEPPKAAVVANMSDAQKVTLDAQLKKAGTDYTSADALGWIESGDIPVVLEPSGKVARPPNADGKKTSQIPAIVAYGKKKKLADAAPTVDTPTAEAPTPVVKAVDDAEARLDEEVKDEVEVEVEVAKTIGTFDPDAPATGEALEVFARLNPEKTFPDGATQQDLLDNLRTEKGKIALQSVFPLVETEVVDAPAAAAVKKPQKKKPVVKPADPASDLAQIVADIANGNTAQFTRFAETQADATPEKPFVNFSQGGTKLTTASDLMTVEGISIDDVVPNADNVINLKQVRLAVEAKAGKVSQSAIDQEDLLAKYLGNIADDVPQDDVRKALEVELNAADIDYETPDILAMYDSFVAKAKADETELDGLTKMAEKALKSFTPNASENKRIRDYAKKLMNSEDGTPSVFDNDTALRLAKLQVMKDHFDQLDVPVEEIPTIKIGGKKVPIREVMGKVRLDPQTYAAQQRRMGTSSAIEGAFELKGAGRNQNGQVLGLLRKGSRLNKSDPERTEIKGLLERGEDFFMGKSYLEEAQAIQMSTDNIAANARVTTLAEHVVQSGAALNLAAAKKMIGAKAAKPTVGGVKATPSTEVTAGDVIIVGGIKLDTPKDKQTIVSFEATGGTVVNTLNGRIKVKKGTEVFADGITRRVYDSPQTIYIKRQKVGGKKDKASLVAGTTDSTVDGQIMDDLSTQSRDVVRVGAPKLTAAELIDPQNGNRLAIIKHKEDPSDIRIMAPRQAANNVSLESLAGKAGIENFEVRYVQSYKRVSDTMSVEAKTSLFNNDAEEFLPVEGMEFQPLGGVFMSGDATGQGFPVMSGLLSKTEISKTSLSTEETMAIERYTSKPLSDMKSLNAAQIVGYIAKAENSPIPKTENEIAVLISDLEQMHKVMRREVRSGYVKPSAVREQASVDIQTILNKVSPEEAVAAARMIEGLGGDISKAPAFDEPSGTFQYNPKTNKIEGTDALKVADEGERTPMLLRETASWAYDNIMTPEDRLEFWSALKRQIASGDASLLAPLKDYKPNQSGAARRIFADNFTSWALENRSAGHFKDKSFWQKIQRTIKGVFDRYFSKKEIDPALEPLFAKVLPDAEMHYRKFDDFKAPTSAAGVVYKGYQLKLQIAEENILDAIIAYGPKRDGSDTAVVNAFDELRRVYAGIVANVGPRSDKSVYGAKPHFQDNTLMPFKRYKDIYTQRFADLNQLIYGGKNGLADNRIDAVEFSTNEQEGWRVQADQSEVAVALIDAFHDGHKSFDPTARPPSKVVNEDFTTIQYSIQLAQSILKSEYVRAENGAQMSSPFVVAKRKKRPLLVNKSIVKHATAQARLDAQIKEARNIKSGKQKGLDNKVSAGDDNYTSRLRVMGQAELEAEFRSNISDAGRQQQISWMMLEKDNLAYEGNLTQKNIPRGEIPEEWGRFKDSDFYPMLREAIDNAESTTVDAIIAEQTRRLQARKFPKGKVPKHLQAVYIRERVKTEADHGVGGFSSVGIPPSAPFGVRNVLSYLTHRDPVVNYTQRTMTYRMINLMGRATRDILDDTNIMDAADVARLAGVDPMGMKNVAMDFRGDAFKKLRSNSRRLAIGLTKGNTNPFDVVHEITHTVIRAGMLPKTEMDAVVEFYRSANDGLKTRINKDYGGKYPDATETQKELILAEEWFAENLTKYMGERVARGDILKALNGGDIGSLSLKNSFHRAIDRAVEYVAYITNGLIGRKSVKQKFRHLMFYGDMFEAPTRSPFATLGKKARAVSPVYAGQYANDVLRQSNGDRLARIKKYTGGGKFSETKDGPITYYHATPNGKAFDQNVNPDVVMSQGGGAYGPGIYISPDAQTLDSVYARRPTIGAMTAMVNNSKASAEVKEELKDAAIELGEVRSELSQKRRAYAEASEFVQDYNQQQEGMLGGMRLEDLDEESVSMLSFERNQFAKTKDDLAAEIDDLLSVEEAISDMMDRYGIVPEPLVLPLYTRMMSTADFSSSTKHGLDDPFMQTVFRKLIDDGVYTQPELEKRIKGMPQTGFNGDATYNMLADLFVSATGVSRSQSKMSVNSMLEDMGYDSLKTTHINTMSEREAFGDMTDEGLRAGTQKVYDAFVLFNPEQAKHIEAKLFNEDDTRMYYRDTGNSPAGFNGALVSGMVDGNIDKVDPIRATEYLDDLEAKGTPPDLVDAMGSIMRQRVLTGREEKAVRKAGWFGFLRSQSGNMERMGMNWLGGWYKQHFPDMSQTFASKFMPIHKVLSDLPDADGKLVDWVKGNAGLVFKSAPQPKSHTRIMKALRFGPDTRHFSLLNDAEKNAVTKIRTEFNDEYERMRKAGMFVGFTRNYVPQVWNPEAIRANEEGFRLGMRDYFLREKTAASVVVTETQIKEFTDKMFDTLAGLDAEDAVHTGSARGSSTSPSASSIDYSRMIRLEQHPAAMEKLEGFLENNLEAMLVKSLEASSRRMLHVEKFGLNAHGTSDYITAVSGGKEGIKKLLSTNKQYVKNFRVVDDGDGVTEVDLKEGTIMPFASQPDRADPFVDALIQVFNSPAGAPIARDMLMKQAVTTADGTISKTYERRVDAIMGALEDFKGVATPIKPDDQSFIDNAMRVSRKQPINGGVANGKTMLNASRSLRTINNVTLLGFTTLTSLGDVVLPIIRSGSFGSWVKASKNLTDPDYATAMKNVGVAMENIVHDRMVHMYGGNDSKFSNSFFNATMLTPWTDTMRQMAGAVGYEAFQTYQLKTLKNYKPNAPLEQQPRAYKIAYRQLKHFGMESYAMGQANGNTSLSDRSLLDSDKGLRMGIMRFANESVFQPNADDVPLWAQTPLGALAFQLKSFPLMMQRMAGGIIREAFPKDGGPRNLMPLLYFATLGPAAGASALAIKDHVQMRGGEDEKSADFRLRSLSNSMGYDEGTFGSYDKFWGWYLEGFMVMGGFGLIADIAHNTASQLDNAAYGQQRAWSSLAGPTYGLGNSAFNATAGLVDTALDSTPDSNAKERQLAREVATRTPILGGIRAFRENVTDTLAGTSSSGGGRGGFSGKFNGSF